MTDIPQAARDAVDAALDELPQPESRCERDRWRIVSRIALEAAAPVLAEATLAPLVKRHAPVRDDQWGGFYCGICWIRGGSRAAWPCSESLAIAALLPASTSEDTPAVPSGG